MKTESSTNSPTATLAPTKSQRDPVGLQATSTPSHLTGDLRTKWGQYCYPSGHVIKNIPQYTCMGVRDANSGFLHAEVVVSRGFYSPAKWPV